MLWIRNHARIFVRFVHHNWPYVLLFVGLILPLWWMAGSLAVRAGLFGFGEATTDQAKLFLTFIAGGIGAAATILGALLTRDHNQRERWREQLDSVVKSLDTLQADRKERSAGVFSSMVLLGHQHVALRVLEPAWENATQRPAGSRKPHIDPATATWVIGQILAADDPTIEGHATPKTMEEASYILYLHAKQGELIEPVGRTLYFPGHFQSSWLTETAIPHNAKNYLLSAMARTMTSQEKSWWTKDDRLQTWPNKIWEECARRDPDHEVQSWARQLLVAGGFAKEDDFTGHRITLEKKLGFPILEDEAPRLPVEMAESLKEVAAWAQDSKKSEKS